MLACLGGLLRVEPHRGRRPAVRRRRRRRRQALLDRLHPRPLGVWLLRRHLPRHRHRLRPRAGPAGLEDQPQRSDEGRRPRAVGRRPGALADLEPRRRRADADAGAPDRRRPDGAQLPQAVHARSRVRDEPPAHAAHAARREQVSQARAASDLLRLAARAAARPARRHAGGHGLDAAARRFRFVPLRDRRPAREHRAHAAASVGRRRRTRLFRNARRAGPARTRHSRDRRRAWRPRSSSSTSGSRRSSSPTRTRSAAGCASWKGRRKTSQARGSPWSA